MMLGNGFGVGLVADTFPVGRVVVQGVWVPGGATLFCAMRVPGGEWGLGVVGSGRKDFGNLSRHMYTVTIVVSRIHCRTASISVVNAMCCRRPI